MTQPRFLFKNATTLLIWPALALGLIALLWAGILTTLKNEEADVRQDALERAASISRGYAEQLQHTVHQIDQMTLNLKYDWENSTTPVNLERQREKGLYPPSSMVYAIIAGADGVVVTSTLEIPGKPDFSDAEFFQAHKYKKVDGLLINKPDIGRRLKKPVVRFSRRLERPDGFFAGVAWASVEPVYLLTFYDESRLGQKDFISVRFTDGTLIAAKHANTGSIESYYHTKPVFTTASGIVEEPGEKFKDNHARFLAWKKLEGYPLVALTALSVEDVFADYNLMAAKYRRIGIAASLVLFLFAVAGMVQSARLAWKKQQEEQTKSIFRLAVDGAREGFYTIRPLYNGGNRACDFQIEDCNEHGAQLLGRTKEELIGANFSGIFTGDHRRRIHHFFNRAMKEGFHEDEMRVPPDSWVKATWIHRKAVRSGDGLAMTIRDISDKKAHEQELSNMANADTLTALPNRFWLKNFLPLAIEQAKNAGTSLAVLFIDLDNFKNINDTLGHQAGDELLKAVAARLKSVVRKSDHAVRLGGDEFTVVLEQVDDMEDVSLVAKAIVTALSEPFILFNSGSHRVQASIGISIFPQDGEDSETLLKHADIAMYEAKAAGKGRYYFYQSHLSDNLLLKINKEEALRQAIERDEFILYYQPRVDASTGKLRSMEALLRWRHPERGVVLPMEFIQVAEDTGLILRIGEQVIAKACAQLAIWKAQGLPLVPISLNVSALQFNEGKVKEILLSYIHQYGIDPELIGVELTESCMVADNATVPEQLTALRKLGIKLLVDDFGTGYSSLSQLQRLDVDILKVDRAFTLQLNQNAEGKAFFKAIVSMAEALGIGIVAEGVETKEQLQILQELACDEIQGYLVSKPVSAEMVPALIQKRYLLPAPLHAVYASSAARN